MSAAWLRLARKELRLEARGKDTLVPVALTALLVVTIGALAFHEVHDAAHAAAGVVWIALALASTVGAARAVGAERDRGTLDTLLALPVERGTLFVGKALAHFVLVLLTGLVVAPLYLLGSGVAVPPLGWLALALLLALGALGLAATGTILSALAAQTRARDAMLPVLMLPLAIPLLVATVHASADVLAGEPFGAWRGELLVLLGYDLALPAASWLLFEAAVGGGA